MKILQALAVVLLGTCHAQAKAVFAHFMVSNAANYTLADWKDDINLAQEAHIQAFALNTAYNQHDDPQYALAFEAAANEGFQLFFSFDYAGNGAWPKASVLSVLGAYTGNSQYYTYNGQPFVSTFEGPESAEDWISIKSQTGCFFVPDWSSLGAKAAMEQANGVADGLFSWAAWPWGNEDMNTFVDASFLEYLNGKPYMMPASPWFYTNLPGYDKNWLWRGDDLWNDRWLQILYFQPEWVEIISWNDYGESHYIGPIRDNALGAMTTGEAPLDYVSNNPHDGWRMLLPFAIDMYVQNTTTITDEVLVVWYRTQPATACGGGDTTGNTVSQLQIEFEPSAVVQDKVFYSAILGSHADVSISIGGVSVSAGWTKTPDGTNGAGRYHGSVAFNGNLGEVVATLSRSGSEVMSVSGLDISATCINGLENWNAYVMYKLSSASVSATPTSMNDLVCTNGTSVTAFSGLCEFGCNYGYCPLGACVCNAMGTQVAKPKQLNIIGYPAAGLNDNYDGLCSFDCNLGYCPDGVCTTVSEPLTTPTVSPFSPPACTGGEGSAPFQGLCSYACNYGYCPIQICSCTSEGALVDTPAQTDAVSASAESEGYQDYGICDFACTRGYCPYPCVAINTTTGSGTPVYVDPEIWSSATPTLSCIPPCVFILPPYTLPQATTITFPDLTTTWTEMWNEYSSTTTVVTVTFPLVTTSIIPVWNINITASGVDGVTYDITPSILPSTTTTLYPPSGAGGTTTSHTPIIVTVISTPVSTSTWPTITRSPTQVVVKSTKPAGPTCTKAGGCGGIECLGLFCGSCGILGCGFDCPGCGGSINGQTVSDCIGGGCSTLSSDCASPTTATVCTEIVSSSAVVTSPTTSWSTTTRTHCDTSVGCDVEGATTTSTMTTSASADPTYNPTQYYDAYYTSDYKTEQAVFSSIQAWYSSYTKNVDRPVTTPTTPTTTTTSASVACTSVFIQFNLNSPGGTENEFEVFVSIDGTTICNGNYACSCTWWTDTYVCIDQQTLNPNGYSLRVDVGNAESYVTFDLDYPPDGTGFSGAAELQSSEDIVCGAESDDNCPAYDYSWTYGDC